jgi:hypothetical protein
MMKTKMRVITQYTAAAAALALLACLVNFISASSGTASTEKSSNLLPQALSQTPLVERIVEHRDFFIRFDGYDENFLCDLTDALGEGNIGLLLLEPAGFLKSVVFDRSTLKKIHEDVSIPQKKVRAELAGSSILVSDARLIAKNIAGLRDSAGKNTRRKSAPHDTPRREAMPQSLPDGCLPTPTPTPTPTNSGRRADDRKIWERLRKDVENNPNVATMTTDEILERFRKEVKQ